MVLSKLYGFYNLECYKILADYSHNLSKYVLEGGVEESKEQDGYPQEERHNKKIRLDNTINNGLQSEY